MNPLEIAHMDETDKRPIPRLRPLEEAIEELDRKRPPAPAPKPPTKRQSAHQRYNASEKGRERRRRYRERHKALGLCVSCTDPAANGIYCSFHAYAANMRKDEWRFLNPGADGYGMGGW